MGAPYGNHNAYKHGMTPRNAIPKKLETMDLDLELQSMRHLFLKLAESTAVLSDPLQIANVVRTMTIASVGISRLVRTQLLVLPADGTTLADEIGRIADEVRRELSLDRDNEDFSI